MSSHMPEHIVTHISTAKENADRIVALAERADTLVEEFRAVIDEIAALEAAVALSVVKNGHHFGTNSLQRGLGLIAHSKVTNRADPQPVAEIARRAWRDLI